MTVAALTPIIRYVENGVTTEFAVPFRFDVASNIRAMRTTAAGAETSLVQGIDFSVTGGSTDSGGTLDVTAPAAAGTILSIWRQTPREQQTDYETNDTFPSASHEGALDRGVMIAQEQDREIARAPKAPQGESGPSLPAAASRPNRAVWFDLAGNFGAIEQGEGILTFTADSEPVVQPRAQFFPESDSGDLNGGIWNDTSSGTTLNGGIYG